MDNTVDLVIWQEEITVNGNIHGFSYDEDTVPANNILTNWKFIILSPFACQ